MTSVSSILPATHLSTLFSSPKIALQPVFLDEDEERLGEGSRAGSSKCSPEKLRRVELRVGGMTVSSSSGMRHFSSLKPVVRSLCRFYRESAQTARHPLCTDLVARRTGGSRVR